MENYLLWKKARIDIELGILKRKGVKKYIYSKIKEYINDEDGAGVIELVLILVVLIGFVVIFKDRIKELLDNVYSKINAQANNLYGTSD